MDFYSFHQWLRNLRNYHKYLYVILMTYVVILTVAIGSTLMFIGPALLAVFMNPWLVFVAIITLPLGVLFINFIFDLFGM